MELTLKRTKEPFQLLAANEGGNSILFDASENIGGEGGGIRPMEALASSLAACASIDVLLILKKQKQIPSHYEVLIQAERADVVPSVFSRIHLIFKLKGVKKENADRAVELSMTKYCSISKMLEKAFNITYSIELDK